MKVTIVPATLVFAFGLGTNGMAQSTGETQMNRLRCRPAWKPRMLYTDASSGRPFAKDPHVIRFKDKYYMYYTVWRTGKGAAAGIAASDDLNSWVKVGEILPEAEYEKNGLAAPAAIVLDRKVHLFYQTYGNGPKDAICHAISDDGIHFIRNPTNPIFRPTGEWNCGRAIDADVIEHKGRLFLYCATRDPTFKVQMLVVASASMDSDFGRGSWTQMCHASIMKPELPWEKNCIEAPSVCRHAGRFYMFYAGAYNNEPQQIGCAVSKDGISWTRLSDYPLLPNGKPGEWNSSESGHPGVFVDHDGETYLFFQGNSDHGKTWYISKMKVEWEEAEPFLIRPCDDHQFRLKGISEKRTRLKIREFQNTIFLEFPFSRFCHLSCGGLKKRGKPVLRESLSTSKRDRIRRPLWLQAASAVRDATLVLIDSSVAGELFLDICCRESQLAP